MQAVWAGRTDGDSIAFYHLKYISLCQSQPVAPFPATLVCTLSFPASSVIMWFPVRGPFPSPMASCPGELRLQICSQAWLLTLSVLRLSCYFSEEASLLSLSITAPCRTCVPCFAFLIQFLSARAAISAQCRSACLGLRGTSCLTELSPFQTCSPSTILASRPLLAVIPAF